MCLFSLRKLFCDFIYTSPDLPVTPAQQMRTGIGRNASCTVVNLARRPIFVRCCGGPNSVFVLGAGLC